MLNFLRRLLRRGSLAQPTFRDLLIRRADELYGRISLPSSISEEEKSALLVAGHLTSDAANPVVAEMEVDGSSSLARTIQASYESLIILGFLVEAESLDPDRWTNLLAVRVQFEAVHDAVAGGSDFDLLAIDKSEDVDFEEIAERMSAAEKVVRRVMDVYGENSEQGRTAKNLVDALWKGTRGWVWAPSEELLSHLRTVFILFLNGLLASAAESADGPNHA